MRRLLHGMIALVLALGLAGMHASALPTYAATLTVTDCSNDSADTGSLPYAVAHASSGDTINFSVDCSGATKIALGATLSISSTLTIDGSGHTIVIDGGGSRQLFKVSSAGNLTVKGLTLQNGHTVNIGGAIDNEGGTVTVTDSTLSGNLAQRGGAIVNLAGTVTITNSTLSNNSGPNLGGGIENTGTATITNSTLSGNHAGKGGGIDNDSGTTTITDSTLSGNVAQQGGGIYIHSGTVTITDSTLSGNSATGTNGGGGIYNKSAVTIANSTLSGNSAPGGFGGGIFNDVGSSATITDSTLSGSSVGDFGGGIDNYGTVTITDSTLSGNSAFRGGAIENESGATANIGGSIIANSSGGNCAGTITDSGYNLDWTGSTDTSTGYTCFTSPSTNHDIVGSDPRLDPSGLQDNGGPTKTILLEPDSPAIDANSCTFTDASSTTITTDQRGQPRPDGNEPACDMGAYETAHNIEATTITLSTSLTPSTSGQSVTVTATVTPESGTGTPTGTVTFIEGGTCASPTTTLAGPTTLDSMGTASFSTSTLSVGSHTIRACYSGDSAFQSISGGTIQVVNPAVSADNDLALTNMPANITTTATSPSGASVTYTAPTVVDEDSPLPTAGCSPSSGSTFAIGTTTVTCSVTDADDTNSTGTNPAGTVSATFTVKVNPMSTTTGLTSSVNPSTYGQSVTLTATVAPFSPGTGTPSGPVTFIEGGSCASPTTTLSSTSLSGGMATYTTSALIVASHSITACYGGDTAFQASNGSITQVVNLTCGTGTSSTATGNFTNTAISSGKTLWFNSVFKPNSKLTSKVTLFFTQQTISFTAGSTSYTLPVPDAKVILDPAATMATTTTYDASRQALVTTVPVNTAGNDFLSGLAFPVPAGGLPGGIRNVHWTGRFTSSSPALGIKWGWGAAVYTSFPTTFPAGYSQLNIKALDDNHFGPYLNSDHAGTPESYKSFLTTGGTGNGGTNYTGNLTGQVNATSTVCSS